ncbi:Dip2/Utp12 family-domain-containing protein [Syncephalis pseudoplumigaleata]|uniref:Dip2/Utp12 family-domain-containing protein n=1 Tax=Syncephalis pseudoplumigaleata TaxID=1712513 RepID=A0A4V1J0P7_9FUNG|nr:Dip2/Utp12 family-domain-containing protein [Syncephalis pseudoplumigaleata]|eukprot:RKP22299.1 Dip2/Utp12 family-domain-containing protein [Syncephalis pseudoplumigaleata]
MLLSFEDDIVQMDLALDHSLLAVSADGRIALWRDVHQSALSTLTGGSGSSGSSSKKKKKQQQMTTRLPATVIRFTSTADENSVIPTMAACYARSDDASRILVARGSSVKPEFEVVGIAWSDELDTPKEMNLKRVYEQGALLKHGQAADMKKNNTAFYKENDAMIVTGNEAPVVMNGNAMMNEAESNDEEEENDGGDGASGKKPREMTIEQQLRQMAVSEKKSRSDAAKQTDKDEAMVMPKANSLQQVLVQALQSNDQTLLAGCLMHSNQQLVHNTVRRLPARLVVPFLDTLIERFRGSPVQSRHYSVWIKAVLLYHTSYLVTLPAVVQQLSLLYQTVDARVSNHSRLLRLSGRLDLLLSQVDVKSSEAMPEEDGAPESVYIEGEEDMHEQSVDENDEDMLELLEGVDSDDDTCTV